MTDATLTPAPIDLVAPAADPAPAAAWYEGIQNPEVKNWAQTKGFKDPLSVAESAFNLERLLGHDKAGRAVVWPKDASDAEGWKAIHAKLGVPSDATGYQIPDAMKDDPMIGTFAKVAHEAGIPLSGFDKVLTSMMAAAQEADVASQSQAKAASQEELSKLQGEWGKDFEQKAEYARRFLRASGWDDGKMQRYEDTFGTATMLKDFFQWGSKTGEAPYVQGSSGGGFAPNKSAVMQKMDAVRAQRIAGQIDERQFHAEMSILGPQLDAA